MRPTSPRTVPERSSNKNVSAEAMRKVRRQRRSGSLRRTRQGPDGGHGEGEAGEEEELERVAEQPHPVAARWPRWRCRRGGRGDTPWRRPGDDSRA